MGIVPEEKCVVVNADDLGFSRGISQGILHAHRNGIVTSASLVANMPASEEAARVFGDIDSIGLGVHLNIAQGAPLSKEGRALADEGGRMNYTAAGSLFNCLVHPRLLSAIEAEYDCQIRWVLDHGIRPDHLDSHRHAHAFRPIMRATVRLAKKYGIQHVRWPREALPGWGWPVTRFKGRIVSKILSGMSLISALGEPSLRSTHGTWGIAHTGRIDAAWLLRAAEALRPGVTEIMTHPGFPNDLEGFSTRLIESRKAELEALCDPQVRESFSQHQIRLIPYGQI